MTQKETAPVDDKGWLAYFLSASRNPSDPMRGVAEYYDELEKIEKESARG